MTYLFISVTALFLMLCWRELHRIDQHMANPWLHSGNYFGAGYEKMPEPVRSYFTLEEIHAAQEMIRISEAEARDNGHKENL